MTNSDRKVISIDLGGTHLKIGVIDQQGSIQHQEKLIVGDHRTPDKIIQFLTQNIQKKIKEDKAIQGISIGIPGIVSSEEGVVYASPHYPQWKNFKIVEQLKKEISLPILIDNDANFLALGELWKGIAVDWDDFWMIAIGTGIGGGLVIDRKICHGRRGFCGEIGHIPIEKNGFDCACGSRGCLETYVSATGLLRMVYQNADEIKLNLPNPLEEEEKPHLVKKLVHETENGDEKLREIFSVLGEYLGMGLASLVNSTGVDQFVIAGGLANAADLFLDSCLEELSSRTYAETLTQLKIRVSTLDDDTGLLGGAYSLFDYLRMNDS